ncbi:hypothetical protein Cadr_000026341 [Camelus dromedarius]|uniref:Uncharacterized protein n=1 Tax=Camelus dromedarius TaxID=9838 RepID=A0A5N4CEP2_CAMDR|nr:hypothetical protein Cadr_000026341 [Camelus dromedarius]
MKEAKSSGLASSHLGISHAGVTSTTTTTAATIATVITIVTATTATTVVTTTTTTVTTTVTTIVTTTTTLLSEGYFHSPNSLEMLTLPGQSKDKDPSVRDEQLTETLTVAGRDSDGGTKHSSAAAGKGEPLGGTRGGDVDLPT